MGLDQGRRQEYWTGRLLSGQRPCGLRPSVRTAGQHASCGCQSRFEGATIEAAASRGGSHPTTAYKASAPSPSDQGWPACEPSTMPSSMQAARLDMIRSVSWRRALRIDRTCSARPTSVVLRPKPTSRLRLAPLAMSSCKSRMMSQLPLSLDDHLERFRLGGMREGLVGIEDAIELEAMRNQELGVDLVRSDSLEQHRYGNCVDQPRGDGNIAVPQLLQMEIDLRSMHSDIGDGAARRDNFLAQLEGGRNAHRLDGGIDAALVGHFHDRLQGLAVGAVDRRRGTEALGHFKAIVIKIDHDDLGRRIELGGDQRGEPNRPRADDRHGAPRRNLAVEHAALEAGWQDVA